VQLTFKNFLKEKKCWSGYVKRGLKKKNGKLVNNCVKENDDKFILAVVETMFIDGIGNVNAKIDSGNEAYNVLHGINTNINGNSVTFTTVNDQHLTAPLVDTTIIHIGSGVKEERPVVSLNIKLKGKTYKNIPFSLADRSENDEPVLVGEPFIQDIGALIDVSL
jgi:hypothetical protein